MTQTYLKPEDLELGMVVTQSSLSHIFNTYITLVDSRLESGDIIGTIAFIGTELTPESDRISMENDNICAAYNTEDESDGTVYYEEACPAFVSS